MAKLDPSIGEHLHNDLDVTVERVSSFGKSDRKVQLAVLAALRATLADQSNAIEIAVLALAFTLIGYFIKPAEGLDFQGMPLLAALVVALVVGALIGLALSPSFGPLLRRNTRQQRAQVWLAAYEDEIQRRRSRSKK